MFGHGLVRVLACLAAVLVALRLAAAQGGIEARELRMFVGEQTTLDAKGVKGYSEGTPGVVDVRLPKDGDQFVLVAQRAGVTTLLLIYNDGHQVRYQIRVLPPEPDGTVRARDNIRLDFYFVQISRADRYQVGVAWPSSVGGTVTTNAAWDLRTGQLVGATAAIASEVLPTLDVAQASGWAKLLRQATLVTANGEEASFSSGGEVNIPVTSGFAADLKRIEFGSQVRIWPRYDRQSGRIEIKISAEVSDLTPGAGEAPGRTLSRLETLVNLELGQSLVLGGLMARNEEHSKGGLPLLSQIPILGALFGSHGGHAQETENVVLIVPTVLEAVPLDSRDRISEVFRIYRAFEGDIGAAELIKPPRLGAPTPRKDQAP